MSLLTTFVTREQLTQILELELAKLRKEFARDNTHEVIGRAQSGAMLIISILESSEEHLGDLKSKAEIATDPTEKANLTQAVQQAMLWHEHLRMVQMDLTKQAEMLLRTASDKK